MTDDTFDPLDELVSAYLDNEATPAERAQVEADPMLLARVRSWTELRSAWSEPPPVPDDERESTIFAALAAFDEPATTAPLTTAPLTTSTGVTSVTPIERARRPRLAYVSWLGAAAAVLAVVLVVSRLGGSNDTDTGLAEAGSADSVAAAAADEQAETFEAAASDTTAAALSSIEDAAEATLDTSAGDVIAGASPKVEADQFATTTSLPSGAGPALDTEQQLQEYALTVQAQSALASTPAPAVEARVATCAAELGGTSGGPIVWQGVAAELVLVATADGTDALVVDTDCAVRVRVAL